MAKKRMLSWLIAASLTLSLLPTAVLATGETLPNPPGGLTEEELPTLAELTEGIEPTDDSYKTPYEEAKEADRLDGEELEKINDKIDSAINTANGEIETANENAGTAAESANSSLEEINKEIEVQDDAATKAAQEANEAANNAKDESLSLEERKEAAQKAEDAAKRAEDAAQKAEEQVTAAQGVVDAAQKALEDAKTAYQDALNEANDLLEGSEDDPGLKAQAQKLIDDATAKVIDAEGHLGAAKTAFDAAESSRKNAWDLSESARIAAIQAVNNASGQQEIIDDAKNQHSQEFVDSSKTQVDADADAAINAKNLADAAQGVVNAQTKVDDLKKLDPLTTAKNDLTNAKNTYDAADKALNGYTDENGNHVKGAQEIAQDAKNNMPNKDIDYTSWEGFTGSWQERLDRNAANTWLDMNLKTVQTGTNVVLGVAWPIYETYNYRTIVNAVLAGETLPGVDDAVINDVIASAKKNDVNYLSNLGNTMTSLRTARTTLETETGKLNGAVTAVKNATGATGATAQEVLTSLDNKIKDINTDGKYNEELKNLTTAIGSAQAALNTAKNTYTQNGGTMDISDIAKATEALTKASNAYSLAISNLNASAHTALNDQTTVAMLNELKTLKANVETAKGLISTMETAKGTYYQKKGEYDTAKSAAESANNQYAAAKAAVETAKENLANAKVSDKGFTSQDLAALNEALAAANRALTEAGKLRDKAQTDLENAKKDAEDARDAYEDAAREAEEIIDNIIGGTGTTDDGDDDTAAIEDAIVPLAGLIDRQTLVSSLYTHEGSPDGVDAEGTYTLALAWAVAKDVVDEEDDPEEVVTVAILRDVMSRYAKLLNRTFTVEIPGEDDDIVMNCDEILTAFFAG